VGKLEDAPIARGNGGVGCEGHFWGEIVRVSLYFCYSVV
jgi:hypothetical protein